MNTRRSLLLILIILVILVTGCQSYTAKEGKTRLTLPAGQEAPLVTKYSVLEAQKQEALAKQEEEAQQLLLEQKLAEEQRKQQEAWEQLTNAEAEARAAIDSLTQEKQELQTQLAQLKAQLDRTSTTLSTKELTAEGLSTELTSIESRHEELVRSFEQLSYQKGELETLLSEQQLINEHLQMALTQAQADHQTELSALIAAHEQKIEQLGATIRSLQTDNSLLKAQLEEKTLTLEEKVKLEQQRAEQVQKAEQEEAERLHQLALEQERLARQEEEQKLLQLALHQQIPPLSELTYPRLYTTDKETILLDENAQLDIMLLTLDDQMWDSQEMVREVNASISDLSYPIIVATGHMQNVIDLVREMGQHAILVRGGAIISRLPIVKTDEYGASVQFSEKKTVRVSVANLPEYEVLEAFQAKGDWQTIQKQISPERLAALKAITAKGPVTEPTIIGASLYEPSHQDWNTFSPVTYRQIDYLWPLTAQLEEDQFYDVYRATHFSSATDAGNTLFKGDLKERVDYLFSRKLLPLTSTMLTIGGESVPDEQGIARYGLVASFLVP